MKHFIGLASKCLKRLQMARVKMPSSVTRHNAFKCLASKCICLASKHLQEGSKKSRAKMPACRVKTPSKKAGKKDTPSKKGGKCVFMLVGTTVFVLLLHLLVHVLSIYAHKHSHTATHTHTHTPHLRTKTVA